MLNRRRLGPVKNRLTNHPLTTPLLAAMALGVLVTVPAVAATTPTAEHTAAPAAAHNAATPSASTVAAGASNTGQPTAHPANVVPAAHVTSVPSMNELEPTGTYGYQQHIQLDSAQWQNAKEIVDVVNDRHLPSYAAVVSLATALQESALRNLTVAVDYDSLGLFQQRPSCGWGAPDQLTDPKYATGAFLDALLKDVPDWLHSQLWQAAQATQQSAFPERYAQWQDQAAQMVQSIMSGTAPQN